MAALPAPRLPLPPVPRLPLPDPPPVVRRAARALRHELARPGRRPRSVWHDDGNAHIELLGPARTGGAAAHAAVCRALRELRGVQWAEVEEGLGRVLVAFDGEQVDVADLVETVADAEHALATAAGGATPARPAAARAAGTRVSPHPADEDPVLAETVALAVDAAAFTAALGGRLTRLPRVPRAVVGLVSLVDSQPRLHAALANRIGPAAAELVIGFAMAGVGALAQQPDSLAISMVARLARIAELRAAAAAFDRRADTLCQDTGDHPPRAAGGSAPGPQTDGAVRTGASARAARALAEANGGAPGPGGDG
ncbi:MAG: heavy-metal-associated domain-containing protein, partial [Frankia sp.]|nr:heavy-metal-associated domain-containing protein [Frankia sp.]